MIWWAVGTAEVSAIIGLSFFPIQRYRYWWRWVAHRDDRTIRVAWYLALFAAINAGAGLLALFGAHALGLGTSAEPLGRCVFAVVTAQALLRGTAPRHGREITGAATLLGRLSGWLTKDLDELADTRILDDCSGLEREQAAEMAYWLHEKAVAPDRSLSRAERERALRRIAQAESKPDDAAAVRELRQLCREILVQYGQTLGRDSERLYLAGTSEA
jgi:hypothetical protein